MWGSMIMLGFMPCRNYIYFKHMCRYEDTQKFVTLCTFCPFQYVRISTDTDPELIWRLLIEEWHLYPPQLLISVTGGAKRFEMKDRIMDRLKKGLIDAAVSTGVC